MSKCQGWRCYLFCGPGGWFPTLRAPDVISDSGEIRSLAEPTAYNAAMQRAERIAKALDKRGFTPFLAERIERLLDGREDRARLSCCSSGCFVCVKELLAILTEVEGDADCAAE